MKKLFFISSCLLVFASCTAQFWPNKALSNTKWELIKMAENTLPNQAKATLNFSKDFKISGKSFCNNYGGNIYTTKVSNEKKLFDGIFNTKMLCPDLNEAEQKYLKALGEVTDANISNDTLILKTNGRVILVFKRLNQNN